MIGNEINANTCRLYFKEQNSAKAATRLISLAKVKGLWQFTIHFNQLAAETKDSTQAALHFERFRAVISSPSVKRNSFSLPRANKSFDQFAQKYGKLLMIESCSAGYLETVKILFERFKVRLDLVDSEKSDYSLVHYATDRRHHRVVSFLVANVAPADLKEKDLGRTPLHFACESGMKKIFQILVDAGANVNALDKQGHTPLHIACSHHPEKTPAVRAWLAVRLYAENADPSLPNLQNLLPAAYFNKAQMNNSLFKFQNVTAAPPFSRDIWTMIFDYLPKSQLKEVMRVNKAFHNYAIDALVFSLLKI